jgi:Lipocalin-like domain
MMSDSELRQALLGTWRLVSFQVERDGAVAKSMGDNPPGYLAYTPEGYVHVNFVARERAELFGPSADRGPVLLETTEANTPLGVVGYSGTFEVRDGQVVHHAQFHVKPRLNGRVDPLLPVLDGDLLTLRGQRLEWQRVNLAESR